MIARVAEPVPDIDDPVSTGPTSTTCADRSPSCSPMDRSDPDAAAIARQRYGYLRPCDDEPSHYGRAVLAVCGRFVQSRMPRSFAAASNAMRAR